MPDRQQARDQNTSPTGRQYGRNFLDGFYQPRRRVLHTPTITAEPVAPPPSKPAPVEPIDTLQDIEPSQILEPVAAEVSPTKRAHKPHPSHPRLSRSTVLHRKSVKNKTKRYRPRPTKKLLLATPVVALVVGVMSFAAARLTQPGAPESKDTPAVLNAQTTKIEPQPDAAPSEAPLDPDALKKYNVDATLPRSIRIPKINVESRVLHQGLKSSADILPPPNIYDVAWYKDSAKPGGSGVAIMSAHISGSSLRGVFYSLGNLQAGDKFEIERGDGTRVSYKVVNTQRYDADKLQLKDLQTPAQQDRNGLNLVTAGGRFDIVTNRFESRLVVFASQE